MRLKDFELERYFAQYEFQVEYLLSPSDCESLTIPELLEYAAPDDLERWSKLKLGYTESKGDPALREEISSLYRKIGPDDLLVVTPEEGILIAFNALLKPGDGVIAIYPAYQSLWEIPRALGCQVTAWPLDAADGKWSLDLNVLEESIDSRTKLLVMNFPHNPSGFLPSAEIFQEIVSIARRNNIYILSDEMYWLLEHDSIKRLPAVADVYEKGISLFGLSKSFGLPGLRIGWLVTQDQVLLGKCGSFKDYTTICASAPSEVLALIGLKAKDRLIKRNLEIIRKNLDQARDFFSKHGELFQWFPPKAGSIAFPKLTLDIPVAAFCEAVVKEKNLMILPGTVFDYPGNHFRIGLGRKDFPAALGKLGEYLMG